MTGTETKLAHLAAEADPASLAVDLAKPSPLAQLLHALNQPLTGLQCAMEVALAAPRTVEQYVQGLREGLELIERMRALVEALREVTEDDRAKEDVGPEKERKERRERDARREPIELQGLLRELVGELAPVAEAKRVSLVLIGSATSSFGVSAERWGLTGVVFRLLESVLSLAAPGTVMRIEPGIAPAGVWMCTRWQGEKAQAGLSRSELGLLVAQARLERTGARWERARSGPLESLTVRFPTVGSGGGNP